MIHSASCGFEQAAPAPAEEPPTMELDRSKSMSGHWGSASCLRCPKCGREEMVSDNIVFARGWAAPPVLPKCATCAPKPAAPAKPAGAAKAGGSSEATVANLQKRFPTKSREEIESALQETGGHAGRASGVLQKTLRAGAAAA